MSIAVVLNTHECSEVFRDTLESILTYLSNDVLVLVDGASWSKFENVEMPVLKLSGFHHGKPSDPYRNIALGLSRAWETWGSSKKWYCYIEYDCLVGSSEIKTHLEKAEELGYWLLGNDFRIENMRIPYIEGILKSPPNKFYCRLLGCCLFFNHKFMKILADNQFFENFLNYTNFHQEGINLVDELGKKHLIYDLSEFLYPTLAVHYGGEVKELACWKEMNNTWVGNYQFYPMRFRPDLSLQDPISNACVMHPIKEFENPVRQYHRGKRHGIVLTKKE